MILILADTSDTLNMAVQAFFQLKTYEMAHMVHIRLENALPSRTLGNSSVRPRNLPKR